ncbi:uncharacterized protein [Amphiura filiformis]|uniref:uncharacterized protein n=1 Tax=Amphiura filiformis TaxID=82378 RepID=UPI003B21A875
MSSKTVLWLIILAFFTVSGRCDLSPGHRSSSGSSASTQHANDASSLTHCKFRVSPIFNSNIKEIFDKSSDLVYLKWEFHTENKASDDYLSSYLENTDVIDPFTWVLARSNKGLRLLTFPFDYSMLSLGTLEPGVAKLNPFKIIITEDQVDCFRNASESDRLLMLANFFLSATSGIEEHASKDEHHASICLERHSRRSKASAEVYLGTHITLQMSSSYSCWSKMTTNQTLTEFKVDPNTPWLKSIVNLEPTWYLILFVVINMASSICFVIRSASIKTRIKRSDSKLNTFIRCARFLTLLYFIPIVVFILTHFENYCKRRVVAHKFSTMTRGIDILHFILGVSIIKFPELHRNSRRMLSRKTLLSGYFILAGFISICLNGVYIAEVIYFTTLGLVINPKTFILIILQAIRSILFIRALLDLHNFLRFEKDGRTIFSFIWKRAIHPEFCFFFFLSLLHTCLDPYNVSPVTASLLAAAFINGIWYKLDYFRTNGYNPINSARDVLDHLSSDERLKRIYHSNTDGMHFAGAYFDSRGGLLSIEGTNIGLFIHSGALDKETFVYMSINEDEEEIEGLDQRDGILISPIVTCGPPGLHFHKKVDLYMPSFISNPSELDRIEASYCQNTSNSYEEWTAMDDHDVTMLTKFAVFRVKHFSWFALFGFGRSHKVLKVTCFGKDATKDQHPGACSFYIWLCDDTKEAFKKVRKEEEELGRQRLLPSEKIAVRKSREIDISITNITSGWAIREDNVESIAVSCPNAWHSSRKFTQIDLVCQRSGHPTTEDVYCRVKVGQQNKVLAILKPESKIVINENNASPNRSCVKRMYSTLSQKMFGDVNVDIGRLSVDAFYEIVTSLGNETDVGCDWRQILQHIGESNLLVDVLKGFCGNSFASAKVVLEQFLEQRMSSSNGEQFDSVETLKQLFQQLQLYAPLRILRRDIGEDGEDSDEEGNHDFELL